MAATRNRIDAFASGLARFAINRRFFVMCAALISVLALAAGAANLVFATNYRVFFGDANPELLAFERFQNTYTKSDNILIVLKPSDGDVFTNATLAVVEDLTAEAWRTPFASRVDSLTNYQHTFAEGDDLIVQDLAAGAADLSPAALERVRRVALREPVLVNQLVTPDGAVTAVNIVLQYPEIDPQEVPQAVAFVRGLVADVGQAHPDLVIGLAHQSPESADLTAALTGVSMLNNSFVEAGMLDLMTLFPIMFLVVFALVTATTRSVSGATATLVVSLLSIVAGFGFGGWIGIQLTPISVSAMVIILTLAVADSVHIIMTARSAMRDQRLAKRDALVEAMRVNFLAVTITSLTTIIGFLALNASDAPPFHDLGNMTAAGIFVAWALSATVLPALLSLLPMGVAQNPHAGAKTTPMERLADFVIAHNRVLLVVVGGAAVALSAMTPRLAFNDQWVEYFDTRVDARRDNDFALEHFGLYPIEFSLEAGEAGGVSDPAFLQALEDFTTFLRTQPNVVHVYSIADIMKLLNRAMNGDDMSFYRLPTERNLAAQYLLLYELSLPYGLDLNDRINIDKSATRLTATLANVTTAETKAFLAAADSWLNDNGLPSMRTPDDRQTQATGPNVLFAYVTDRNVASMIRGTILAVAAIAVVMILALRSVGLGLLTLIPNGLPILTTFGAWALLVGTVGFSVAAVASVSLGIVVDDTVHFMTKYLRGLRERGQGKADAIRYAFRTVGAALVVNTVVLAIGFAVLTFSTFKLNADLGLLTALAIVFALILDFLLLPALLLSFGGTSTPTAIEGAPDVRPLPAQ